LWCGMKQYDAKTGEARGGIPVDLSNGMCTPMTIVGSNYVSSRSTFAGTQHPTFQFEVRGQEWLVLTRPGATEHNRGRLVFPRDIGFLVMGDSEHGPVVAEVSATDGGRALSVRPGRYFVRGRASDALLEGTVAVAAD